VATYFIDELILSGKLIEMERNTAKISPTEMVEKQLEKADYET